MTTANTIRAAVAAMCAAAALSHAKQALSLLERRDELDRQYNGGKWKHWYDRDIIYPCRSVTEKIRKSLKGR